MVELDVVERAKPMIRFHMGQLRVALQVLPVAQESILQPLDFLER